FVCCFCSVFFFNDTATTEIYTLSLPDALPIRPTVIGAGAVSVGVVWPAGSGVAARSANGAVVGGYGVGIGAVTKGAGGCVGRVTVEAGAIGLLAGACAAVVWGCASTLVGP